MKNPNTWLISFLLTSALEKNLILNVIEGTGVTSKLTSKQRNEFVTRVRAMNKQNLVKALREVAEELEENSCMVNK